MTDLSPGSKMREILNKEFQQDKHKEFRQWYFNKYSSEELKEFKNKYNEYLGRIKDYISFVQWFIKYYIDTTNNEILVLQKSWKTTKGETINSPFPPEQTICLNSSTEATAYLSLQKIESAQITIKELNAIIKSQNYMNTFLNCLGDQFISLEQDLKNLHTTMEKQIAQQQLIDDQLKQINQTNQRGASTSALTETPMIQPQVSLKDFKKGF